MEDGIETEGSNLSGVSSRCSWEEPPDPDPQESSNQNYNADEDKENIRNGTSDGDRPRISDLGELSLSMGCPWDSTPPQIVN